MPPERRRAAQLAVPHGNVPLSQLLNPLSPELSPSHIPRSEIPRYRVSPYQLPPYKVSSSRVSPSQINTPRRGIRITEIVDPRRIPIDGILNSAQEVSYASTSKSAKNSDDEGEDGEEISDSPQTSTTPTRDVQEKTLAQQIAEHIIFGVQNDVEAPQSTFWRTINPMLSQLEMANILWERSLRDDDPGPVRWVNRFYAACMYRILSRRGSLPIGRENAPIHEKENRDLISSSADIINLIANKLGVKVYAGLAISNVELDQFSIITPDLHHAFSRLVVEEVSEVRKLPNKYVRDPASVISQLWDEE
ncbi:hypothetical protein F5Y14DRAFT_458577 [Nemania sp. NC0429]|nr:hypothetical protein F5Y14DRAFT_458577 [Nemania sp. NC0429]